MNGAGVPYCPCTEPRYHVRYNLHLQLFALSCVTHACRAAERSHAHEHLAVIIIAALLSAISVSIALHCIALHFLYCTALLYYCSFCSALVVSLLATATIKSESERCGSEIVAMNLLNIEKIHFVPQIKFLTSSVCTLIL